jgi:hypothetical protein
MQRLFEFIAHHPYLASGVVLAAVAVAVNEVQARLQAFAALSAMQAVRSFSTCATRIPLTPATSEKPAMFRRLISSRRRTP